jgi:hypothetical protein
MPHTALSQPLTRLQQWLHQGLATLGQHVASQYHTLSWVLNTQQFEQLLNSLHEAKTGQVVSLAEAFGDVSP